MYCKVTMLGRITKQPELLKTKDNQSVVEFSLALNYKQDGKPDYIRCEAWRASAEYLHSYVHKGDLILVEGLLKNRTYEIKGEKRNRTVVVCNLVKLVKRKGEDFEEGSLFDQMMED